MGSIILDRSPVNLKKVRAAAREMFILRSGFNSSLPSPDSSHLKKSYYSLPRDHLLPPALPLTSRPKYSSLASSPRKKPRSGDHHHHHYQYQQQKQKPVMIHHRKEEQIVMDLESVYTKSPPPSSLPLPRFTLTKPKATGAPAMIITTSCIGEAEVPHDDGGVDTGATDNLRRLLGI